MSIFDIFAKIESERKEPAGAPEFIIVGLGNPGLQYENTRHNVGYMMVDTLAEKNKFTIKRLKFKSLCGDTVIAGKRCLVMKPTTFMNSSGEAVAEAMNFYKIPIENIIIICDDINLAPGKLRIRRKGSAGGHNGLKSIIALCGSEDFPRIKVGIGQKPHPDMELADWVLGNFTKEVLPDLHTAADKICEVLPAMIEGKIDKAMNLVN